MHIEDADRLFQKDLREKNKRKRYEVRYDVEAETRKEGMSQYERMQELRQNKISMDRYKELLARGFDIITNEKLEDDAPVDAAPTEGPSKVYEYYRTMQDKKKQPGVWSRAMKTINRGKLTLLTDTLRLHVGG